MVLLFIPRLHRCKFTIIYIVFIHKPILDTNEVSYIELAIFLKVMKIK